MRALLIKKWGEYYAGQVLTHLEPGSLPADSALWYGDDEVIPVLPVFNDVIDPASPELAGKITPVVAVAPVVELATTVEAPNELAGE